MLPCGEEKHKESCIKKCLNCNVNHKANSEQCQVIKKEKEIDQIMIHINVGFLEARKMIEKWPQSWRSNRAFSSDPESLRKYVEPNMRNFPILKTPRRQRVWDK
jgi:hypothetical protein